MALVRVEKLQLTLTHMSSFLLYNSCVMPTKHSCHENSLKAIGKLPKRPIFFNARFTFRSPTIPQRMGRALVKNHFYCKISYCIVTAHYLHHAVCLGTELTWFLVCTYIS